MRGVPGIEKFNPSILDVVIVIKTDGRIMSIFKGMDSVSFFHKINLKELVKKTTPHIVMNFCIC